MGIKTRVKREIRIARITSKGYSRRMAAYWAKKARADYRYYKNKYDKDTIKEIHRRGYLCRSINRYDLLEKKEDNYIKDFDYMFISPYNNSFSKWLEDMLTTGRVLKKHSRHMKKVYFSLTQRDNKQLILQCGGERKYDFRDVFSLIREEGVVELRPARWLSKRRRYKIEKNGEMFLLNGKPCTEKKLISLLGNLRANYVITEYVPQDYDFREIGNFDFVLTFWLANDLGDQPEMLYATAKLSSVDAEKQKHESVLPVNKETGTFVYDGKSVTVEGWSEIKSELMTMCKDMVQLSYFSTSICLCKDGGFKYLSFSANPFLPKIEFDNYFNEYLKEKVARRKSKQNIPLSTRYKAIKNSRFIRRVQRRHKGMRPYMQRLWNDAVKNDLLHTKGVSLSKKIWAWKRGFQSFRIKQYGLTEKNYKNYLSDHDYFWLNRINNSYQIWINDKTTFRYSMDNFKEYVPKYFFSVFKREGNTMVAKMWDCPEDVNAGIDGLFQMLEKEKKLAMKPSAETHGDGFCCLEYDGGKYYVNGEEKTREEIIKKIEGFGSFYVVTEYIYMHDEIKKIYDKSVNTVRVMVINRHGYDPKIMQTYMRIGSSRTGYTDNVGYGGICAMIDTKTGELYQPEGLKDHEYFPQPIHPDSGTPISGKVPNWELACQKVIEICRSMPELEYLGFDVAITNDGFRVIEINIHQDLHKVAEHSDEIKEFFRDKLRLKREKYGHKRR